MFRPPTHRRRAGFTLVELLVILAILGVLLAILLPAVQAAHEAARRAQCQNNLKQLAIAVHSYHDQYKLFPPGNVGIGACCNQQLYTNWAISILPFIEQSALAEQYSHGQVNNSPANRAVVSSILKLQTCPTDIDIRRLEKPETGNGAAIAYAPGSYRAVAGLSNTLCWSDNDQMNDHSFCQRSRGILHYVGQLADCTRVQRQESFSTVVDGTTHTFLIGEYHTQTHSRRRTFWAYSYAGYSLGSITLDQPRALLADYDRCVEVCGLGDDNVCKRGFGSFHPGVIQFALGDGSVRPMSITTSMTVWEAAATSAQGEMVHLQ